MSTGNNSLEVYLIDSVDVMTDFHNLWFEFSVLCQYDNLVWFKKRKQSGFLRILRFKDILKYLD